jgi:hypothetical protein
MGGYKIGRPDLQTFKGWIKKHIEPDIPSGKISQGSVKSPTDVYWKQETWEKGTISHFADFVRDTIAWDKYASVRAEKAARDPSSWDHDDMDMLVQLLDEGTIDQIVRIAGGARQQVSTSGIKNAFAGMNEFIRREITNLDKAVNRKKEIQKKGDSPQNKLDLKEVDEDISNHYAHVVKMIKSFIIFDATVETRFDHSNANKVRFSDSTYNTNPGCSGEKSVKGFIEEVRGVIGGVASRLGMEEEFKKVHSVIPVSKKGEWDGQTDSIKNFNINITKKMDELKNGEGIEKVSSMLMSLNHLTGLIDKKTDRKAGQAEMEEVNEAVQKKAANDNADISDLSEAA